MESAQAYKSLQSLWSETDQGNLKCLHCDRTIEPHETLGRTYTLKSHTKQIKCTGQEIPVPTLDDAILIHNRHLECLLSSTRYITISHVWHSTVADLQYRRSQASASVDEVEQVVRETPAQIARGLYAGIHDEFEIWHDYISVPQWNRNWKTRIIESIPDIYQKAQPTVIHLSDISEDHVRRMREWTSPYERARAISKICNAKWFSRMWTAMEFTRSHQVRFMFQDFKLVEGVTLKDQSFVGSLMHCWRQAHSQSGQHSHVIESEVGMGYNLVPWQLGELHQTREQNLSGDRIIFATAYTLLARRCVTIPRDFFHGILGILNLNLVEADLKLDSSEALIELAMASIKVGDFSPFFMLPGRVQKEPDERGLQSCGYTDLLSFGIGKETSPATYSTPKFHSKYPIITAELLGTVSSIKKTERGELRPEQQLTLVLKSALEVIGIDAESFAISVSVRLFGQKLDKVLDHMSKDNRITTLTQLLARLQDTPKGSNSSDEVAREIGGVLGLLDRSLGGGHHGHGDTPVGFMNSHGGTLHLGGAGAIVVVSCASCHQNFPLRIALFHPASELGGVTAFRIPGLMYTYSLPGGCGVLLKDGHIVGRFLWGAPTCLCQKLEEIEVRLDKIALPISNRYNYGSDVKQGWVPLYVQESLNLDVWL